MINCSDSGDDSVATKKNFWISYTWFSTAIAHNLHMMCFWMCRAGWGAGVRGAVCGACYWPLLTCAQTSARSWPCNRGKIKSTPWIYIEARNHFGGRAWLWIHLEAQPGVLEGKKTKVLFLIACWDDTNAILCGPLLLLKLMTIISDVRLYTHYSRIPECIFCRECVVNQLYAILNTRTTSAHNVDKKQ